MQRTSDIVNQFVSATLSCDTYVFNNEGKMEVMNLSFCKNKHVVMLDAVKMVK